MFSRTGNETFEPLSSLGTFRQYDGGSAQALIIMSLTYLALSLQLNLIAKNSLHGKIKQIEHSLNEDMDTNTQIKHPHDLQDIVLAHKNLNLSIYGVDPPTDNFIASEEISLTLISA